MSPRKPINTPLPIEAAASLRTSKTESLKEDGSISPGKLGTRSRYMTRIPRGFGMLATPDRRTPPPRRVNSAVRRYQTTPRPPRTSADLCRPPPASADLHRPLSTINGINFDIYSLISLDYTKNYKSFYIFIVTFIYRYRIESY